MWSSLSYELNRIQAFLVWFFSRLENIVEGRVARPSSPKGWCIFSSQLKCIAIYLLMAASRSLPAAPILPDISSARSASSFHRPTSAESRRSWTRSRASRPRHFSLCSAFCHGVGVPTIVLRGRARGKVCLCGRSPLCNLETSSANTADEIHLHRWQHSNVCGNGGMRPCRTRTWARPWPTRIRRARFNNINGPAQYKRDSAIDPRTLNHLSASTPAPCPAGW